MSCHGSGSPLSQTWFFELTTKHVSQDLRAPFIFSLYPEAPQSRREGDPPLPLLRPIHLYPGPRDLRRDRLGMLLHWLSTVPPSAGPETVPPSSSQKISYTIKPVVLSPAPKTQFRPDALNTPFM